MRYTPNMIRKHATYRLMAVRPTPPPTPVRQRDADWQALDPTEREDIEACQRGDVLVEVLTLAGQVFLRRHDKGEKD